MEIDGADACSTDGGGGPTADGAFDRSCKILRSWVSRSVAPVVMRAADNLGGDTLATFRDFGGDRQERLELVRDGRLVRFRLYLNDEILVAIEMAGSNRTTG